MYVLPDGRVFAATTAEEPIASRVLELTTGTWSVVDPAVRDGGSSAMYLPGKIIKSGSARNPDYGAAELRCDDLGDRHEPAVPHLAAGGLDGVSRVRSIS